MARHGKAVRSFAAGLAVFLLTIVALAQDGGVVVAAPDGATRIDVMGVLIAPRSRSALINGRILRVGDRIGDIEVVAIKEREVRLRAGNLETGVTVGTSPSFSRLTWSPTGPAFAEPAPPQVATAIEAPVEQRLVEHIFERSAAPTQVATVVEESVEPENPQGAAVPEVPSEPLAVEKSKRQHPVASGETLSEIAEAYLVPGVRRSQLMMALFEANPHAFNGNINRMRAGVVLEIPDVSSLEPLPHRTAMARVMEQTDRWKNEQPRHKKEAQPKTVETYGPVSSGETLSHIAYRLSKSAADAAALMSALYDANPHAFGNSMDMLRVGVVLKIPDAFRFHRSPDSGGPVVARVSTPRIAGSGNH